MVVHELGHLLIARWFGIAWVLGGAFILIGWAMRETGGTAYRRTLVARLLGQLTAVGTRGK